MISNALFKICNQPFFCMLTLVIVSVALLDISFRFSSPCRCPFFASSTFAGVTSVPILGMASAESFVALGAAENCVPEPEIGSLPSACVLG